jgi:hypothetical protein
MYSRGRKVRRSPRFNVEAGALYRGSSPPEVFTPRAGKDTSGWPDNGLSTWTSKAAACVRNTKVQVLNPAMLAATPGMRLVPDPANPVHVFVTTESEDLLLEWAASRPTAEDAPHRLTVATQDAIEREDRC